MDLSLELSPLHFNLGEVELTSLHHEVLSHNIAVMKDHPELKVLIGGVLHPPLNTMTSSLSKKRCLAIKDFLIHDGIQEDAIVIADPLTGVDVPPVLEPIDAKVTVALKFFIFTP